MNAVAPPFEWEFRDNRLRAHGSFGAAHEGPPGYVHGGWIALAFDEALGIANVAGNTPGMTARLTVRYRRPTPLRKDLVLEAWTEHVEGRRIRTVGTIADGDIVTLGIEPTGPSSAFGYIEAGEALPAGGGHRVVAFTEKPSEELAAEFLARGSYFWNAGMFVTRTDVLLGHLDALHPQLAAGVREIAAAWDTADGRATRHGMYMPPLTCSVSPVM